MSTNTAPRTERRDPDRISAAGTVAQIFFILAAAILFNFFPQSIGYVKSAADPGTFTPVLGPSFAAFMPWLNTLWFWSFCLCLAHLTLRRWTAVTRSIDLVLDLCGAAIVGLMFFASPFRDLPVVTTAIRSALAVLVFVFLLEALQQLVMLVRALWKSGETQPGQAMTVP